MYNANDMSDKNTQHFRGAVNAGKRRSGLVIRTSKAEVLRLVEDDVMMSSGEVGVSSAHRLA